MIEEPVAEARAWDLDRQLSLPPSNGEKPRSPGKEEPAGFRHFCKSLARVQEILCWAAVENVLTRLEDTSGVPAVASDLETVLAKVRAFAHDLTLCTESAEGIKEGYLDCDKAAAFVQLFSMVPHTVIVTALRNAHLDRHDERPAPFHSFASFLFRVCNLAESSHRLASDQPRSEATSAL